jgi:hypothetical protein
MVNIKNLFYTIKAFAQILGTKHCKEYLYKSVQIKAFEAKMARPWET